MQSIPIFLISLARAVERRQAIVEHLNRLGLAFTTVDAVDGNALSPEYLREVQAPGVDHHPGLIGCYLSHMDVYRRMVAAQMPVALVLEDDAVLNPAFARAIRDGVNSSSFDYCFLDSDNINENIPVYYDVRSATRLADGFTIYRTSGGPAATHAYLITGAAAARRLEYEFPMEKSIDIYTSLPYTPRFYAVLYPKGAGVSENSMRSFASARDHTASPPRLRRLRTSETFYIVRDLVSPELIRRRLRVRALVRAGLLPSDGEWRPLPTGRPIIYPATGGMAG